MQRSFAIEHDSPMMEMNTTPLIDVMLVLLVMFIITIPIQTHAVKLDLPQKCVGCPVVDARANTITISSTDQIAWNGTPVSMGSLRNLLRRVQQMQPAPELHLQPDATARYEIVDEVLAVTKQAHVQKMGFVGNEYYMSVF